MYCLEKASFSVCLSLHSPPTALPIPNTKTATPCDVKIPSGNFHLPQKIHFPYIECESASVYLYPFCSLMAENLLRIFIVCFTFA